jgi:hypothetical protein
MGLHGDLPDIGAWKHDARGLPTQLQGNAGEALGGLGHDHRADRVGPGEGNPIDSRVRRQLTTDVRVAGDHVQDAGGQLRPADQLAEKERRQRGPRRWEQDDGAPDGQRGSELEDREVKRVVVTRAVRHDVDVRLCIL